MSHRAKGAGKGQTDALKCGLGILDHADASPFSAFSQEPNTQGSCEHSLLYA